MARFLGNVSTRHLKVGILFARHEENLHLSHSRVGFALSESRESVPWEPGGWHSCSDGLSRPSQSLDRDRVTAPLRNSYCRARSIRVCLSKISCGLPLGSGGGKVQAGHHGLILL